MDPYVAKVASDTGVSPNIINAIIAFLQNMLSSMCPVPPTAAKVQSGDGESQRALYRAMLANGIRPLSAQGVALANSMIAEAKTASDAAVAEFLSA